MALITEALPLVNEALVLLGERPFVSLTDPTNLEHRRSVEAVYETTYRSVFRRLCPARFRISVAFTTAVTLPRTPGTAPTDPDALAVYKVANTDVGRVDYPLVFSPATTGSVGLPDILGYLGFTDSSGYPILDFELGDGIVRLPSDYTAGATALVLVRPPESQVTGQHRALLSAELAARLGVRLGVKGDVQQMLRQTASLAWRDARGTEGRSGGSHGDFLFLNPHDKNDNGDTDSWLMARI